MTDPTAIRWESLGTIAGAFALAVWALRDSDGARAPMPGGGPQAARFRLKPAGGASYTVDLENGAILGRGADCSATIDDNTVSKHHCRVGLDGRPWIEDLGSTNGTYVNGRRISGSASWLRRGDRIALGTAKLVFLGLVRRSTSGPKG
jgi:hypothetical protein